MIERKKIERRGSGSNWCEVGGCGVRSEDEAFGPSFLGDWGLQGGHNSLRKKRISTSSKKKNLVSRTNLVKHVLQPFLRQSRTFYIFNRSQLSSQFLALFTRHRPLLLPLQFLIDRRILPQIDLSAYDETRDTGTMMMNFGEPFFFDVFE